MTRLGASRAPFSADATENRKNRNYHSDLSPTGDLLEFLLPHLSDASSRIERQRRRHQAPGLRGLALGDNHKKAPLAERHGNGKNAENA